MSRSRSTARRITAALALPALVSLAACGGGTTEVADAGASVEADPLDDADIAELEAQAEEEGEVVVYSFTSRIAEVEAAFEEQYPAIDLIGNDISSTEQIARITAEANAGTPGADVAYLADAPVVLDELVETGLLRNYVPPRLAESLPDEFQQPLLSQRLSTKVFMYNEEAHPDGPPVTNLWELTDEEWAGRVILVDPAVRGDYLDLMAEIVLRSDEMEAAHEELYGEPVQLDDGVPDAGSQWIKDLYGNDVVLVDDTDNVNAAIGSVGQEDPPVGFTSYSDRRDNEDEGWALQTASGITPSPGIAYPAYAGIVDGAEHPAAARLFVDFLMGDDSETGGPAYEPFYVAGDYPTRTDMVAPEDALSLDDLGAWVIDPEEVSTVRSDVSDFLLTLD
jgi:iron(III) transport system substrate-binding protein